MSAARYTRNPPAGASHAKLDPWARLACGVLAQAGIDARGGDNDAKFWLAGDDAAIFAEVAGIDRRLLWAAVDRWAVVVEYLVIKIWEFA